MNTETTARLLISCDDKPGIVATISNFLYHHGANITALDQHSSDPEDGTFLMRLEFQTPHLNTSQSILEQSFAESVARPYKMDWRISYAAQRKRTAILVSRQDHALLELLWRWSRGQLPIDITQVISNHTDAEAAAKSFGVPFNHVPVDAGNKAQAEGKILGLLSDNTDLVVLARYMQILSADFISHYPQRIINIHHSFLPAFVGADPYRRAAERGVKIIGATAHYVTADLDEGPIIEQDVKRVSHRHEVEELKEIGRDIERNVLARAVRWHAEDRILLHQNRTVVFAEW
ncbi:MAG: formyltetrahydrofolate deformylase [Arenicellales bacterium]